MPSPRGAHAIVKRLSGWEEGQTDVEGCGSQRRPGGGGGTQSGPGR